ncbi:AAA family ATPase [Candidatus Woesearchaeota archaeon]|nr:AAA family ATPase [Candidatus Woesearchaeota archaeon]
MAVIIVSGTPGTGKSFVARRLAHKLGFRYVDVKKVISRYKLRERYDKKRKSWVVDEKRLARVLEGIIKDSKEDLIIDSHLSHFINPKLVDLCIITKCDLKKLEKRLKKKRYNKDKIRENLECEIFDICLNEAHERGHTIFVINTTHDSKSLNIASLASNYGKLKSAGRRAK